MKYEFKLEIDFGEQNSKTGYAISEIGKILSTIHKEISRNSPCKVKIFPSKLTEENTDSLFEKWWSLYGKKRGRKKTYAKWCRMSMKDKVLCLDVVEDYVKSTPDPKYRKDPLTYLNGECWNDEIISQQNQTGGMNTGIILKDSKNKEYKKGGW